MKHFPEGYLKGFQYLPNFIDVKHTALDVCNQYYHAKKIGKLDKDDESNRWLQFSGEFIGNTSELIDRVEKTVQRKLLCHIYANWIAGGATFGRHQDTMSVLIVQVWNNIGYYVESCIGSKSQQSFILKPGDALYIHKGTWHTPIVISERMTMSFSWS